MDSLFLLFKQLVHLNFNLAILIILAWLILGRGRGWKTRLTIWTILLLRVILEPWLCPESLVNKAPLFGEEGMLSIGVGLNPTGTLIMLLELGGNKLTIGEMALYALNQNLVILATSVLTLCFGISLLKRLWQLSKATGKGEGIVWTRAVSAPCVSGWYRPSILMPLEAKNILSPDELKAVLMHEKAHIRKGDHRIFALSYLLRSVCWLVPPLYIILNGIEQSLEQAADLEAATKTSPLVLAQALVKFAEKGHGTVFSPAFSGSFAEMRLRSLRPRYQKESVFLACLSLLFLGAVFL